jgi:hypothetical protein
LDSGVIGIVLSMRLDPSVIGLGLWQLSLHHEQTNLQELLTVIVEARRDEEVRASEMAEIHVRYERRPKNGKEQPCLVLTNTRKAEARDIYVDTEPFRGALYETK